jgi:hypothetical protein
VHQQEARDSSSSEQQLTLLDTLLRMSVISKHTESQGPLQTQASAVAVHKAFGKIHSPLYTGARVVGCLSLLPVTAAPP